MPDIDRIAILEARPGDVLVLHAEQPLSMETAARIRDDLTNIVPPGVKCVVLDSGMSLHVIRGEASVSCPLAHEVQS